MAEVTLNLYKSTLGASYTAGGTSIQVASAASSITGGDSLPSSGEYSLMVADASTGIPKALFHVTSRSGTTLSTTAEIDANCSSSDIVYSSIISTRSFAAMLSSMNQSGLFASRPSSGSIVGQRYVASDAPHDEYVWNGSLWQPRVAGMPCTKLQLSDFGTTVTASGLTINTEANSGDGIYIQGITTSGGDHLHGLFKSIPSAPYTVRIKYYSSSPGYNFYWAGIALRDSATGKLAMFGHCDSADARMHLRTGTWNSETSFNGSYNTDFAWDFVAGRGGCIDIGFQDDGTNRLSLQWVDGVHPHLVDSHSNTTFLTPDQIGIAFVPYSNSGQAYDITYVDWTVS